MAAFVNIIRIYPDLTPELLQQIYRHMSHTRSCICIPSIYIPIYTYRKLFIYIIVTYCHCTIRVNSKVTTQSWRLVRKDACRKTTLSLSNGVWFIWFWTWNRYNFSKYFSETLVLYQLLQKTNGEAWSYAKLRTVAICHDDLRPRAFWNASSDSQKLNSVSLAFLNGVGQFSQWNLQGSNLLQLNCCCSLCTASWMGKKGMSAIRKDSVWPRTVWHQGGG